MKRLEQPLTEAELEFVLAGATVYARQASMRGGNASGAPPASTHRSGRPGLSGAWPLMRSREITPRAV